MNTRIRSAIAFVVLLGALAAGLVATPAAADVGAEADFVRRIDAARTGRGLGRLQDGGEAPPRRLVLVLDRLAALDDGR